MINKLDFRSIQLKNDDGKWNDDEETS